MTAETWSLSTFNAGDKGIPPIATIVAIQERPSSAILERTLTFHDIAYPKHSALAIAWDRDLVTNVKVSLTRIHGGTAKVTPSRYLLTLRGRVRGRKVAVINSHLVNNAFGVSLRGERPLRARLWAKGWRMVQRRRLALTVRGYKVFVAGDFNRKDPFWPDAPQGCGKGYDRIFYPAGVECVHEWHGDRNGSDHRPLSAQFRFK